MSKSPTIDHEYHHGKDKFKITMKGYALGKKTRREILEKLVTIIERSANTKTAAPKKKKKNATKKK